MRKILLLLAVAAIFTCFASAQVTLSLPEINPSENNSVLTVPVNVTGFNNIGAISIKISYDPNVLTFIGTPNPLGPTFSINAVNGTVIIGWFNSTPLNLGNDKLLDLNFQYSSGNSNLNFLTQECDIANAVVQSLPVSYQDGKVNDLAGSSIQFASIGNKVWNDLNSNGIQDAEEPGVQWVTVELFDCNDVWKAWTITDANGEYLFDSLDAGDYKVKFYLVDNNRNFRFTVNGAGDNDELDSDVEALSDTIGQTTCITLSAGQDALNWDAGIRNVAPPVNYGSVGNFVWNDLNCNGIQDDSEPGVAGVTVKLLNCNFDLLKTTTTNSNGLYLFDNLTAGIYCVQFVLPSGYQFAPKDVNGDDTKDSDPDAIHGRTDCFTLAEGENNLTIDAGLCEIDEPGTPELCLSKDDGKVTMPDTGKTTIYTISYENTGNGSLYNAVITDTLPYGVTFVSASDGGVETSAGSNVVVFDLGTLAAGVKGSVSVMVRVVSFESEYLNSAYLTGKDALDNLFIKYAEDLNFNDTTSSGGGGGVESKGDMAELLLMREWKIRNGLTTPILSKNIANNITSQYNLSQLIPVEGPYNSFAVETTPFDILGISNAVESYAVDYKLNTPEGERRVAGIFSTTTIAPDIYDHTKVVCDRLGGSAIEEIKLVEINGNKFYAAKLRKASGRITDYAISFSVYEIPSGFLVENKWTWMEYQAPAGASSVYNFQAWSSSYEGSIKLVKDILEKLSTRGSLSYLNTNQTEPDVFIKNTGYTHDGKVHLTFVNNSSQLKQVTLNSFFRYSQGDELLQTSSHYTVAPGESQAELLLGIIADAQIQLSQASGFKDEVFVSGGAYAYISGPNSSVTDFSTTGYPQRNLSDYPAGSVVLSGGFYISGMMNDWITVVRALSTNGTLYDLRNHDQLTFEGMGSGKVLVFLDVDNVTNFNYFTQSIVLNNQNKTYSLNMSDFKQLYGDEVAFDASLVRSVGFIINNFNNPGLTNFNLEIKDLAFLSDGTTSSDEPGLTAGKFDLVQNFPNPFNPSTVIEFSLAKRELISLKVYDMLGQEIITLVNNELDPGKHSVKFDASVSGGLSSGVYFYRLQSASGNITKKMTLTK